MKQVTDQTDKYHTFKMISRDINDQPSFVFKCSKLMAQLMLEMDIHFHEKNLLQQEYVYFDAMHSRCEGFKTLTLWVYNLICCSVLHLATVEVEIENTDNIELFWTLLNKFLTDASGKKNYKLNPLGIIVDDTGANLNALVRVFGEQVQNKIVTCQWHFLECACKQISKLNKGEKETFWSLAKELISAPTVHQYNKVIDALKIICQSNDMMTWLQWWEKRRFQEGKTQSSSCSQLYKSYPVFQKKKEGKEGYL